MVCLCERQKYGHCYLYCKFILFLLFHCEIKNYLKNKLLLNFVITKILF